MRFLDRLFTIKQQRVYLTMFLFFGMPIGYLCGQGITILSKGWNNYHFEPLNMIVTLFADFILITPLIINHFKYQSKYTKIFNKYLENKNKNYQVKAVFNYDNFVKGETYQIFEKSHLFNVGMNKKIYLCMEDCEGNLYNLEDLINKFDLNDIKEERRKKLKKLNRFKWDFYFL